MAPPGADLFESQTTGRRPGGRWVDVVRVGAAPIANISVTKTSRLEGATLLVVDDEAPHVAALERLFTREGAAVHKATSGAAALELVKQHPIQLVLADLMMPQMSGQELLEAARAVRPEVDVIVMTAYATVENAVAAMREGAYDFIQKPFKSELILRVVERALERQLLRAENLQLRKELREVSPDQVRGRPIVGRSPAMLATLETIQQAAPSTASVLLIGESGTGKELMARALHELSPRIASPFVVVNCAALPESILEAELFGYEKGAFTGATDRRIGRIERAGGGTLFLDEVGELSPAVQAKFLRVLQEGEIERLGGDETIRVDFRLVAATNRDLEAALKDGTFREDLYYRLNVIGVSLPALRERPEDVALLAEHFVRRFAQKNGKPIEGVSRQALSALCNYGWPGNVRELENVIERAVVLTRNSMIDLVDLPAPIRETNAEPGEIRQSGEQIVIPVGTRLDEVERVMIHETLKKTGGDKSLAAQLLGIAARTIYRKLEAERSRSARPPDGREDGRQDDS